MGLQILHGIANDIQSARFFTLVADETTNAIKQSQLVVVIRWICDYLEVFEDFIGINVIVNFDARSIVSTLKDVLLRINISILNMRGQCYDGCSTMTCA